MRILKPVKDLQVCKIGSKLPSLDFAGNLSALTGANATKAGIPYTCLFRSRMPYLNAYVPVGSLGLAQAVLSCIDWRPARFFLGAGEVGSMLELCGLKASGNAQYVGLQSLTALPVRGIVGEAVVLELLKRAKEGGDIAISGRNSERPTSVVWAEINKPENIQGELHCDKEGGALLNYVATSVNVIVLILMAMCHDWCGFALVATGMFVNAMMAFLLRQQKFMLPDANPSDGAPPGDAVILLKDDPDVFCVLGGSEKAIQKLLQKEIMLDAGWVKQWPLFLVAVACQIYSVIVIFGVPHLHTSAQFMWTIVVLFGALTDLLKGSFDCKRDIAKDAIQTYGIKLVEVKKFGNRTASVASVAAGKTKLDTLKAAGLLPTAGAVWQSWWTALKSILDDEAIDKRKLDTLDASVREEDQKLWKTLKEDMFLGLKLRGNVKLRKSVGNMARRGQADAPLQSGQT